MHTYNEAVETKLGDQRACEVCNADIEFHGKTIGWIDRGSNTYCDESGMVRYDENGVKVPYPHRKHTPYKEG